VLRDSLESLSAKGETPEIAEAEALTAAMEEACVN